MNKVLNWFRLEVCRFLLGFFENKKSELWLERLGIYTGFWSKMLREPPDIRRLLEQFWYIFCARFDLGLILLQYFWIFFGRNKAKLSVNTIFCSVKRIFCNIWWNIGLFVEYLWFGLGFDPKWVWDWLFGFG